MRNAITTCMRLSAAAGGAAADPCVTARLGYASADFSLGAPYNGEVDDEAPAWGVNLGYRFSDLLAVEAGAMRFGDLDGRATPGACRSRPPRTRIS